MCGIFGHIGLGQTPWPPERLQAMARSLIHRGPDDEGIWCAPGRQVSLGNRRLSIIDVAGGHQPFVSRDGRVVVVQNGEIYNHVELRAELTAKGVAFDTQSDTEVILRYYEHEGIACLKRLNGMFAIAIWDGRENGGDGALFLARDRVGVKPLYVWHDTSRVALQQGHGTLAFASEIKALLAAGAPTEVNPEAIHHYLSFNYVPPPLTIRRSVQHVMPGTYWRVDRRGVINHRWWNLAEQRNRLWAEGSWAEAFLTTLDDAVRIRMRSDVPFGAFLSGGVDSSTVVGLMARHASEPVRTFCIGFDDPRFDESAFAAQAAQRFGTRHVSETVSTDMLGQWPRVLHHCDQPHGDASFMPTLRVSELAAREVKVVLTGDGGDELFAGYDKYAQFFGGAGSLPVAWQRAYFDSTSVLTHSEKLALYSPVFAQRMRESDSFDLAKPWFDEAAHHEPLNQALYFDTQMLLCGNNLVKPDRMGMAVSIENREPFLDWRIIELAFQSPASTKLRDGDKKHWFKRAVTPLIGEDLAYRKKQMFTVPIGEWFKTTHRADLEQAMFRRDSAVAGEGGLCDPVAVRNLLDEHVRGAANHTRSLRALWALAIAAEGDVALFGA
jgi:asparagine synthase (glutamine-hydrolysing)